ncbi:MAG: FeoB-associated Cys-rich membrane protein [Oscillospiraceae bacterium]
MGLADVIVIVILVLIPTAIGFIKPSRGGCHGCGGNCGECSKCSCCERKNGK